MHSFGSETSKSQFIYRDAERIKRTALWLVHQLRGAIRRALQEATQKAALTLRAPNWRRNPHRILKRILQTRPMSVTIRYSLTVAFQKDNHGPQIKRLFSLEHYFFRLKKQKGVICGKEHDNFSTIPMRYYSWFCFWSWLVENMPREWYWRDTSVMQNQNLFTTPIQLSFFAYLASNLFSCSQIIFTLLPCNKRQKLVDCISANFNRFTCGLKKCFGMVTPLFVVFLISVIFRLCLTQDHHRGQAVYISQLSLELYWLKSLFNVMLV